MQRQTIHIVICGLAFASLAVSAQASPLTDRYRIATLIPEGPGTGWARIDESGNLWASPQDNPAHANDVKKGGDYRLDHVYSQYETGRTIDLVLHKVGSEVNVLPDVLRNPNKAVIEGYNASGIVIGNFHGDGYGKGSDPFYYDVGTKEFHTLKTLLGVVGIPALEAMNDRGQIVGTIGGKVVLYASPDSVPVELSKLIDTANGWTLSSVTGINNRGEIVGLAGNAKLFQYAYYKLEPIPTPEPSSVIVFAAASLSLVISRLRAKRSRMA